VGTKIILKLFLVRVTLANIAIGLSLLASIQATQKSTIAKDLDALFQCYEHVKSLLPEFRKNRKIKRKGDILFFDKKLRIDDGPSEVDLIVILKKPSEDLLPNGLVGYVREDEIEPGVKLEDQIQDLASKINPQSGLLHYADDRMAQMISLLTTDIRKYVVAEEKAAESKSNPNQDEAPRPGLIPEGARFNIELCPNRIGQASQKSMRRYDNMLRRSRTLRTYNENYNSASTESTPVHKPPPRPRSSYSSD